MNIKGTPCVRTRQIFTIQSEASLQQNCCESTSASQGSTGQHCEHHRELVGDSVTGPIPVLLNQKLHFNKSFKETQMQIKV